jgi:hypothetical protein
MPARPLAALCALTFAALAPAADVTLKGLKAGGNLSGPKVFNDDLPGKVVLVEYWGLN